MSCLYFRFFCLTLLKLAFCTLHRFSTRALLRMYLSLDNKYWKYLRVAEIRQELKCNQGRMRYSYLQEQKEYKQCDILFIMDPFKYTLFWQLDVMLCVNNSRHYFRELFQIRGAQIFQRSRSHLNIIGTRIGDINHVHHWRPQNIFRHPTKFSRYGDLTPGICVPMFLGNFWLSGNALDLSVGGA